MIHSGRVPPRNPARAAGFTLIEMMIAITIGLGLLAGLVGVLASNSNNARTNDRTSELMTNGRYALDSMKAELREAGFRGYTYGEPSAPSPWTAPASGCAAAAEVGATPGDFVSNIRQGVWGSNDLNPFDANCIPAARYAGGDDVLVVRRLAILPTATADLKPGTVYFQSTYERGQIFNAPSTATSVTPPTFTGAAPLASFAVQIYVYYISPSTDIVTPESPRIPSLRRLSLQGRTGLMVDELVASGIEHMQVQYGQRTDLNVAQTETETQYLDTISGTAEWNKVNSVRLWLLARNSVAEPGLQNGGTYDMGNQSYVVNDSFRRQMFSTVIQLRN